MRRFREEDEPDEIELNEEDEDWENVPSPDEVVIMKDDGDGVTVTELGEFEQFELKILSQRAKVLSENEYLERSGKKTIVKRWEFRSAGVAVFHRGKKRIIRFIPKNQLDDLLESWVQAGVVIS